MAVTADVVDVCVLYRERVRGRQRADAGAGFRWCVLLLQRGAAGRCPGSWEIVHGSIEAGERAEAAARREVHEETGLQVERLYTITVNAFYLAGRDIKTAVVFAAIVGEGDAPPAVTLGVEHTASAWHSLRTAMAATTWPRERQAMEHIAHLLRSGDAGVAEDVLRVR